MPLSECIFGNAQRNATALRFNSIKSVMHCYVYPSCWHHTIGKSSAIQIVLLYLPLSATLRAFQQLVSSFVSVKTTKLSVSSKFYIINFLFLKTLISFTTSTMIGFSICNNSTVHFFLPPSLNLFGLICSLFGMQCPCFSYLCFAFVWSLDLPHITSTFSNNSSILLFSRAFVHFFQSWLLSTSYLKRP